MALLSTLVYEWIVSAFLLYFRMIVPLFRMGLLAAVIFAFVGARSVKAERIHKVRSGDSLSRLAKRYKLSIKELKRANRLRSDNLKLGQKLRIPGNKKRRDLYTVKRGDNLIAIAAKYKVPVADLRRVNRIRGDKIRLGEKLRIPGRRRENYLPKVAKLELDNVQLAAKAFAKEHGLGTAKLARFLLSKPISNELFDLVNERFADYDERSLRDPRANLDDDPAGSLEVHHKTSATLSDESKKGYRWDGTLSLPIDKRTGHGWYMRGWGAGAGGYHLAVDIFGVRGTPTRSVERGMVVYAGTGVRGYGRFVLVLHESGLVSAYAHHHRNLVVPGQLVQRGQQIGEVGNTGISRGPHLHFMLIHQGKHCDPVPLFNPAMTRKDGNAIATQVRWSDVENAPVRCLPKSARPHPGHVNLRTKKKRRHKRR